MKVRIKKLSPEAKIPSYSKPGDAGLDLTATSCNTNGSYIEMGTGLAIEIPDGFVGLIFPRSSISNKDLLLYNSVGVCDSKFRGEIKFRFKQTNSRMMPNIYEIGDRIGQLIILPFPQIEPEEVQELSETERGQGSYGSTGK